MESRRRWGVIVDRGSDVPTVIRPSGSGVSPVHRTTAMVSSGRENNSQSTGYYSYDKTVVGC